MRNIIKYALCIVLSLALIFGIIVLPYFYFDFSDNARGRYYDDGSYSFDNSKKISFDDVYELIHSSDSIIFSYQSSISENQIINEVKSAVAGMLETIDFSKDDEYLSVLYDCFNSIYSKDIWIRTYNCNNISGKIDDTPASISLMEVYMGFTENNSNFEIIYNQENMKIYSFAYYEDKQFQSYDEYESYAYDYYFDEYRKNMYDALLHKLIKYEEAEEDLKGYIADIGSYYFSFSVIDAPSDDYDINQEYDGMADKIEG